PAQAPADTKPDTPSASTTAEPKSNQAPPLPKISPEVVSALRKISTETNSLGMKLALLPAGEFKMGAPTGDKDALKNERPVHQVQIQRPFAIGTHEVTVGQFRAFVEDTGYQTDAEKEGSGGTGYDSASRQFVEKPQPQFNWKNTGSPQTDNHPVVNVSLND